MNEVVPPTLRLRVITSHRLLAEEEVQEVTLPSLDDLLASEKKGIPLLPGRPFVGGFYPDLPG